MRQNPTRRSILQNGLLAASAVTLGRLAKNTLGKEEAVGDTAIPFLESLSVDPKKPMLRWDALNDWITPADQFFAVSHYGAAAVAADSYKLTIDGRVTTPIGLSLDDIRKRPRKDVTATLECSGNGAGKTFVGAIGNAKWTGTPLAPLLDECGIAPDAVEVAFWGADHKVEKIRDADYDQNFARTLSLADARRDDVILAYEMNGRPLEVGHGFPLRLIVPGWYGIAWVKWLQRIELREHRLMNRFMARDYVTIRGKELPGGHVEWTESSVGPLNVKSLVARAMRRKDGAVVFSGAAWSGLSPLKAVEVRVDDGPWQPADLDASHPEPYTWRFWSIDWKDSKPGVHTVVSRAIDSEGNIQPAADDPAIKLKKTYWEANQQWPRQFKL